MRNVESDLDMATCMFGRISDENREKIVRLHDEPTAETWDEANGIILAFGEGVMLTLWQAVLAVDSTFTRTGRATDLEGNVLREWARVPEPAIVRQALAYATH